MEKDEADEEDGVPVFGSMFCNHGLKFLEYLKLKPGLRKELAAKVDELDNVPCQSEGRQGIHGRLIFRGSIN
jgi:hypothetical protein